MVSEIEKENWLDICLEGIKNTRVAIFGDFCLDAYWQIDTNESGLAVETGLPVRRVRKQLYSLVLQRYKRFQ